MHILIICLAPIY